MTTKQKQQNNLNKKKEREIRKMAHKKATSIYAAEREKINGMGAEKIADIVNTEFGGSDNNTLC